MNPYSCNLCVSEIMMTALEPMASPTMFRLKVTQIIDPQCFMAQIGTGKLINRGIMEWGMQQKNPQHHH